MSDSSVPEPAVPPPPGPSGGWPLGELKGFRNNAIELFQRLTHEHGDVVGFKLFNRPCLLIRHPDHIRYILKDNHRNYGKQTRGIQKLKSILGEGLLTADGSHWRRQRRIAGPTFRPKRIGGFAEGMVRAVEDLLSGWEAHAGTEAGLDINEEMMRVGLRIAGETLFSTDITDEAKGLSLALKTAMQITNRRVGRALDFPTDWPTPENRRFDAAMAVLDRVVGEMIDQRRADAEGYQDLLTGLIHARDEETGEAMSDVQLKDEVMTLLLAGHETTANALTWTWYLLSDQPSWRAALQAELDAVLGDRPPVLEDLPQLDVTTRIIRESLRLLPPGWLFGRNPIEDDVIGGFAVPKDTLVMVSSYITHRHPEFWGQPERFDPDRFLPERSKDRHPFAYFPFSGGPRGCIGAGFALMELQLLVARIAQRYELQTVPDFPVELEQLVTLRPLHGLRMRLHPRA